MQVTILWYPGASFGSRTPPIFGCQTRKLSATNQQWSLWLYTKHLMDMFPRFWVRWSSTFGKNSIFHHWQGFSANNFTSRNAILFTFFKAWKAKDSLTCKPNFLFSDVYLNLLFNLKSWSLVRLFLSNVVHVYYYTLVIRINKQRASRTPF